MVVKNGKIVAQAHNMVLVKQDATCHAEIQAIRAASKKLGRFDLSDCEIYSTCEPCPMCFAAIHWAKIKKLYFGGTRKDATRIGFDDQFIYDVILGKTNKKQIKVEKIEREKVLKVFEMWEKKKDKKRY